MIQDAETLPATDSQLEDSRGSSKAPSSPVQSVASVPSTVRTPSNASMAVSQLICPTFMFYSHTSLLGLMFEFLMHMEPLPYRLWFILGSAAADPYVPEGPS